MPRSQHAHLRGDIHQHADAAEHADRARRRGWTRVGWRFCGYAAGGKNYWLILAWAIAITGAASAEAVNPVDGDPRAIGVGAALFANRCAECHGADAEGLAGSDLKQVWQSGTSDERVFEVVRAGIPDTIMPASTASDNDIWAILAYLRSISTVVPFAVGEGDAGRGRKLFFSQCSSCHTVAGTGGSLGPDLSRIAQARSRERLVAAIRHPSAQIALDFRTVTLVLRDGTRVSGIKKGEDSFSIQILDVDERLRGYLKTAIDAIIREQDSLMQDSLSDQLPDAELEDLLAFLATLR
jgi:putative heme-binding domain-containing protein